MAMTIVTTGKIYNGKVYSYKDKQKNDRELFRGRLNYRDRSNGEWHFIDVVCWKDFGDKGGLVAWLDTNFSMDAESAPTEKGGQPIEIVGNLVPTTKLGTGLLATNKAGKKGRVDAEHPSFELVIESADFVPAFEKYKGGTEKVDQDFDFDEDEDIEEDEDEDFGEVEEEPAPPPKRRQTRQAPAEKKAPRSTGRPRKTKPVEDDDKEFFDQ